jgi:hypothetical protein
LSFRGRPDLLPLFDEQVRAWAEPAGASVENLPELPLAAQNPWALAQAPLDNVIDEAQAWLAEQGGAVHAYLGQGLIQLNSPADPGRAQGALLGLHGRLGALGGQVEHASLEPDPKAPQAHWEAELLRRLEALA